MHFGATCTFIFIFLLPFFMTRFLTELLSEQITFMALKATDLVGLSFIKGMLSCHLMVYGFW